MIHGLLTTYVNGKCRCDQCREANRVYHQQYRQTKRRLRRCLDCSTPIVWRGRCEGCRERRAA
jgi:hypothetical protein